MTEGWVHTLYPDRALLEGPRTDPIDRYVCDGCTEAFEGDAPVLMKGALASGELTFCSWRCAISHCQEREDERVANAEGPPLTVDERRLTLVR
jgi:hypothetical protein